MRNQQTKNSNKMRNLNQIKTIVIKKLAQGN